MRKTTEILLVEDNEGDILLTQEAFDDAKFEHNLSIVRDGDEALDFLFRRDGFEKSPKPDIILLDLNLPKVGGKEVLSTLKTDTTMRSIPIIVLTSSEADKDILESYNLNANSYLVKPVDVDEFIDVAKKIENFWFEAAKLPN